MYWRASAQAEDLTRAANLVTRYTFIIIIIIIVVKPKSEVQSPKSHSQDQKDLGADTKILEGE